MSTRQQLLTLFYPYRVQFGFALMLILIQASIPGLLTLLIQQILDEALIAGDQSMLAWLPVLLISLYGINGIITYGRGMLTRKIAITAVCSLRDELMTKMLGKKISWRKKQATGDLLMHLTDGVGQVQYIVSAVITGIQQPLTLLGLAAAAIWMSPPLAAIGLLALPFIAWPIMTFGRDIRSTTEQELQAKSDLQISAVETLNGFKTIKAMGVETHKLKRLQEVNEDYRKAKIKAISARLKAGPIVEFIAAIGVGAAIYFGGQMTLNNTLKPGELIAFLVAMGLLNGPLKGIGEMNSLWQRAIAGAEPIFTVMAQGEDTEETAGETLEQDIQSIRFENVHFKYDEQWILKAFNLTIKRGEVVGLMGRSGCGKSTVAQLLLRFYQPEIGHIYINSKAISTLAKHSLRSKIGTVFQDPFLFNATIAENISMGRNPSQEELWVACEQAQIAAFIRSLPLGLNTPVLEFGARLSGGQKQRLCIARALIQNAPILILDEPTSQLDQDGAMAIYDALFNLMAGRCCLLITHDPMLLKKADRIVSMTTEIPKSEAS